MGVQTQVPDINTLGHYALPIETVSSVQKNRSACIFKVTLTHCLLNVVNRLLM
jgi:hypothetical protein